MIGADEAGRDSEALVAPSRSPRVGLLMHQLDGELTGVGRYMTALTTELCRDGRGVDIVPLVIGPLGVLESLPEVRNRAPREPEIRRLLSMTHRLSRFTGHRAALLAGGSAVVALAARRLGLDVVHDLTGVAPFVQPGASVRRVLTVHDLISYLPRSGNDFIDDALQRRWLPIAMRRTDGVIAVSATTAGDIQRLLSVDGERIHMVPHGVDPAYRTLDRKEYGPVLDRHDLAPGYVLFVGSASPRKNLPTVVAACRRLWSTGCTIQLAIAGPVSTATMPDLTDDVLAGRIKLLGYVAERELPALYNGAAALAFPSSYEGFGLPALEAMSCGTPVIAGRGGALPEVVGDAAILVEPRDANGISDALISLIGSPEERSRLRADGAQRARTFTWARTAALTAAVYHAVVGSPAMTEPRPSHRLR